MLRHHMFRPWIILPLGILVGVLYIVWATNVSPWAKGIGAHRYAHWLFTPTPFFFLIAFIGFILVGCAALSSSFGLDQPTHAWFRWKATFGLLYVSIILGVSTLIGTPIIETQRIIRQPLGWRTYVLQGISGGSGNMFYRLYRCDRFEFVCTQLTDEPITLFLQSEPILQIDPERQQMSVVEQDDILFTVSVK